MTGRRITLIVAGAALALAATAGASKPPGPTTGTGLVFSANPVQDLGNENLTDQKDARSAVPLGAYHQVPLTNLDGSGFLQGQFVRVRNDTGPSAYSTTGDYRFFRDQGQFEQVMAYYWITEAQKYLQRLGFTGSRRSSTRGSTSASTSGVRTTRSSGTSTRSCGSARAMSTTPRTPR